MAKPDARRSTLTAATMLLGAAVTMGFTASPTLAADDPASGAATSDEEQALQAPSHIVNVGETLTSIAADHGVEPDTLIHANGLVGEYVRAGFRLFLALPLVDFSPTLSDATHTVGENEDLDEIAEAHGTTVDALMHANHIHEGEHIHAGDEVIVRPGWQCPVVGAEVTNDWGYVKPSGRAHEGVDIFAPRGAAIRAPVAGHVDQTEGATGGKQFTLYGVDGTVYFGSHMEDFGQAGDVAAGATIGTVGTSGNAQGTSPHVHFEVHPGSGFSANPFPVLAAVCE